MCGVFVVQHYRLESAFSVFLNSSNITSNKLFQSPSDCDSCVLSVGRGELALFRIEYCQLPAFASLQVDQIFSYRFILY
jgi:hypothetical protein